MVYSIRSIQRQDIPQVYKQMLDLVRHEGIEASFKMTPERMERELFGPDADWYGLVAVAGEVILGFCFIVLQIPIAHFI